MYLVSFSHMITFGNAKAATVFRENQRHHQENGVFRDRIENPRLEKGKLSYS